MTEIKPTNEHELAIADTLAAIGSSYLKARQKHAPMHSPHEGYAVLLEEVDELWDEVKAWQPYDAGSPAHTHQQNRLRKEALHVAAMALAFLIEVTPDAEVS